MSLRYTLLTLSTPSVPLRTGDVICEGQTFHYHVTLTYDGHVREVAYLGLDDFGNPDTVDIE